MNEHTGSSLSWLLSDGVIELTLDRPPANEIGLAMLADLERFVSALPELETKASALILCSAQKAGFSAGADLRELYRGAVALNEKDRSAGVREFLERIHAVLNWLDQAPFVTIAAVHGVCFGGGLELALVCDVIIADKMARFAFPELRLGLIPGFGGIPRLKRDLGNGFVRDLLLTGRSVNATRAQSVGLVAQLAAEGESLKLAKSTATQITKFDSSTPIAAKKIHQAHPPRGASPGNRNFLRTLHPSRCYGRLKKIRRKPRPHALPAVASMSNTSKGKLHHRKMR